MQMGFILKIKVFFLGGGINAQRGTVSRLAAFTLRLVCTTRLPGNQLGGNASHPRNVREILA